MTREGSPAVTAHSCSHGTSRTVIRNVPSVLVANVASNPSSVVCFLSARAKRREPM